MLVSIYEILAGMFVFFGVIAFIVVVIGFVGSFFRDWSRNLRKRDNTHIFVENKNPEGLNTGDCAIRGISHLLNQDWDTTYDGLIKIGKSRKQLPNNIDVMKVYLKKFGYIYIPDDGGKLSVRKFLKNKHKKYLLHCYKKKSHTSHAVYVNDGVFIDSYDSRYYYMIGHFFKLYDEEPKENKEETNVS